MAVKSNKVASWNVIIPEGEFLIEFEHGTTSGKRVVWINGKEIIRREWMFRLVGPEIVHIGRFECKINVEPDGLLGVTYSLSVNSNDFEHFMEMCKRKYVTWMVDLNSKTHRIILEKDSMDVWVDGIKTEQCVNFAEGGIEIKFWVDKTPAIISSKSSGNKKLGICYHCFIRNEIIQADSCKSD